MSDWLVRFVGFPATLLHGDTLVLDRWLWLAQRLRKTSTSIKLLDVGCGSGGFTIGLAKRGYKALGIDYSEKVIQKASKRAPIINAPAIDFRVVDVRLLDNEQDLANQFDALICMENIEHILNDQKLMKDMAKCLRLGGKLYLSTPNYHFRAITKGDNGPFSTVEDGGHVRRGYTDEDLTRLCTNSGLVVDCISYCSGFLSQKTTWLLRRLTDVIGYKIAWVLVLPLRIFPPLLDPIITSVTHWPEFSICLEAHRNA
ncbi:MAG: methyltransferase domain-containing protein [Anaerolinea sp.]|nr:methyltransferase domain-containing protein [Anaerolinea sp.]